MISTTLLLIERAAVLTLFGATLFVLGSLLLAAHYRGVERLRAAARRAGAR